MGIRGLTTYISQRSGMHLKNFELHDSDLVIDGNSLAVQMYTDHAQCNCAFGGDYDKYAQSLSDFFDSLAKCNITALVLIDGGSEEKKIQTLRKRTREKIKSASGYNPSTQKKYKFFPLLMKETFKEVMTKKRVKFIQTLFEADDDIASVAKVLDCPVLSFDSDFYIYDVKYIPFKTLDPFQVKSRGEGYVKCCKIYRVDSLLKQFKGLERLHLPLAATLFGNDYVSSSIFKEFFRHLKLSKATKMIFNEKQRRIEATFVWLSKHSPQAAISQILARLPQESRKKVLEVIEMIINVYTTCDPIILLTLGFEENFVLDMKEKFQKEPFKFQDETNNLQFEDTKEGEEIEIRDLVDKELDDYVSEFPYDSNIHKVAPEWFIKEFNEARYGSYFMDILTMRFYDCRVQIEDYSQPAAITICTDIISVIYGLLTKGLPGPKSLSFLCRENGENVTVNKVEAREQISGCDFPSLFNLRDLPIIIRKKILDETLGIPEFALDTFPNEWKLFVATAIFWMTQKQEPFKTKCHLYSLLFGMMFGVVDNKIGHHRSEQNFHQNFDQVIETILNNRENEPLLPWNQNVTVYRAFCQISRDDCILAMPFLLNNFEIDKDLLYSNSKKFHVSIVHAFAQFQICLRHSLHLNALLGCPYQETRVSEMYNGTLLYNLYCNFKRTEDIDLYISIELQGCQSLLRLFNVLLNNVKKHLGNILQNEVSGVKKKKGRIDKDENRPENVREMEPEDLCYFKGKKNRFSVLKHYEM